MRERKREREREGEDEREKERERRENDPTKTIQSSFSATGLRGRHQFFPGIKSCLTKFHF